MFRFEYTHYAYAVPLVVLLLGIGFYLMYKRREWIIEKLGRKDLVTLLLPVFSRKRFITRAILITAGVAFLFLALANPQYGNQSEEVESDSSDVYIAFDISQSMLSEDISPSRLSRAQKFTVSMIEAMKGNRIGLIYFAGVSYLQMPLTTDYAAAASSIKTASPSYAGTQGTSISEAIEKAMDSYTEKDAKSRTLIIVSDGEDHEAGVEDKAREAAADGMNVFTIGVGTQDGGYVPYNDNGREAYKKDAAGTPVISKLNVKMLQDIAKAGQGAFYMVDQGDKAIDNLLLRIQSTDKSRAEMKSFTVKNSYFQYLIALGIILLGYEWYLTDRKIER